MKKNGKKNGKFEPSPYVIQSHELRKIQAHQTWWNQRTTITYKPEYLRSKFPLNKITKYEGVTD